MFEIRAIAFNARYWGNVLHGSIELRISGQCRQVGIGVYR